MKNDQVKKITGVAILLAIEIVLQAMGNYITPSVVSINLSLIPIALGAILYGPLAGALLGFGNGLVVLLSPSTEAFLSYSLFGTIVVCLLKCTIAGFLAGFVYKLIAKKNTLIGSIVASLVVPVVNTGLFVLAVFTIFFGLFQPIGTTDEIMKYVFLIMIGWNFVIEFSITAILSPTIARVINIIKKEQ
ncbi:MAG: ECF transporter S component [Bacilli bacterium]|nr:ECF transporter S component [Bacilli bacterium]